MIIQEKDGKVYANGYDIQQLIDEHNQNEKISYYGLLGLIKDGNHPGKVIFDNRAFNWSGRNYADEYNGFLSSCINEINMLDDNIIPIYN